MKQVFFSEKLNRYFDSKQECIDAEEAYNKRIEEEEIKKKNRANKAKEVEEAFKAADAAYNYANDKLKEFCKEYGAYHFTTNDRMPLSSIFNLFDNKFWL